MRLFVLKPFALSVLTAASCLLGPVSADAQYSGDPATGELYTLEVAYGWWNPEPLITISSEGLGLPGTEVDFSTDLGIDSQRLSEFRAVLRPARKHKFKVDYLPISYGVEGHILTRPIVFNGQVYTPNIPVDVEASFTTWRVGYEYDFFYRDRGYVGLLLEAKYTKAKVEFDSPITTEFAEASAPIPAIGVAARGYLLRNVSVTGEFSVFSIPGDEGRDYSAHYYDFDVYGTVSFNRHAGVMGGWRRLDLAYVVDRDSGDLDLTGFYVLGIVRF